MEEQQEKKSSVWIWILVVLILLAVGIGAYFWLTGDSSPIANGGNAGISGSSIPRPPALPIG